MLILHWFLQTARFVFSLCIFPFPSFTANIPHGLHACKGAKQFCHPQKPRLAKGRKDFSQFHCFCRICFSLHGNPDISGIREGHLSIHPTKNCRWKREIIPDTKTHRSWELIPPPLPVILVVSKWLQKVMSRVSPAPGKCLLKCLEMPFKFIFLPSTVFKQRVIFNDQRILKFKYLGIEFLLLLFKEQHNKKTLFFFFFRL